jgi:hypothetical protein
MVNMPKPFNPESTTFTNLALDKIMPRVSPSAWKILCLAVRKTVGWRDESTESGRKESDVISISQFMEYCGMSSKTAVSAVNECIARGYLIRKREDRSFRYSLNLDYELPDDDCRIYNPPIVENTILGLENLHTQTVSINSNVNLNITQENLQEEQEDLMNAEEYKKQIEKSIAIGMSNNMSEYSNYPEQVRPVINRIAKLWNFKPPLTKGSIYAKWIKDSRDILDGCGEYGIELLDKLHDDWKMYLDTNGGFPPYNVHDAGSLVSAVYGKAAQLRSGSNLPFWKIEKSKTKHSILDV